MTMLVPEDLRYSTDHEWVRMVDNTARVGITDYAQDALGDVVFVQLPAVGDTVGAGAGCGEVESTKSVSDVYAPIDGIVTLVNEALASKPELINEDPYGAGWLYEVEVTTSASHASGDGLMDAAAYSALTEA